MVTISDLRYRLKLMARVTDVDLPDTQLDVFLRDSLREHDLTYVNADDPDDFSRLGIEEEHPLLLLAWIQILYFRAGKNAKDHPATSGGTSADPVPTVDANIRLALQLREQYDLICSTLGIGTEGTSGTVQVGEFVRFDPITNQDVPSDSQPRPPSLFLKKIGQTSSTVSLQWEEPTEYFDFYRYIVYRGTAAGLKDETTLTEDNPKHRGIVSTATEVKKVTERWLTSFKVTGLSLGTHYFIVVNEDLAGKLNYSNEISVTLT